MTQLLQTILKEEGFKNSDMDKEKNELIILDYVIGKNSKKLITVIIKDNQTCFIGLWHDDASQYVLNYSVPTKIEIVQAIIDVLKAGF